jgi:hypothetical protein
MCRAVKKKRPRKIPPLRFTKRRIRDKIQTVMVCLFLGEGLGDHRIIQCGASAMNDAALSLAHT